MYAFWLLSDIREYLISVVTEMFLILVGSLYDIKDLYGHLLVLCSDDTNVTEGLQGLSVFSLKHHFELFSALFAVVFGLYVNNEGLLEVDYIGVENSPLIVLVWGGGGEYRGFPLRGVAPGCYCVLRVKICGV